MAKPKTDPAKNKLFYGDNLEVMRQHVATESVDLVYLDPPFNSNRSYNVIFNRRDAHDLDDTAQIQAFDDTWHWTPVTDQQYSDAINGALPSTVTDALVAMRALLGENDAMAYLVNMAPRLVELHRVLRADGTLYLHCDPTMSHYLKVVLDAIFGATAFRNEIVWHYSGWNKKLQGHYERRHDVIFMYAKGTHQTFEPQTTAWASKEEYLRTRKQKLYREADGREYVMSDAGKGKRVKRYVEEAMAYGRPLDDVWNLDKLNNSAGEALGYPTQKPLALLERIIRTSSKPGGVVLDPFCGCGTTVDAAESLGRRWIGIDVTYIAIDLIDKRLHHTYGKAIRDSYEILGIPRDLASAQALADHSKFDFERWAVSQVNAQPNQKQVGDRGVDGVARFPLDAKGSVGRVIVSVKAGQTVGPTAVRDLIGTLNSQKSEMGVLILLHTPSRGVIDAVNHGGTYTHPANGQVFPRVQVVTVDELLAGNRPNMPATLLPYIQASKAPASAVTPSLFDN